MPVLRLRMRLVRTLVRRTRLVSDNRLRVLVSKRTRRARSARDRATSAGPRPSVNVHHVDAPIEAGGCLARFERGLRVDVTLIQMPVEVVRRVESGARLVTTITFRDARASWGVLA